MERVRLNWNGESPVNSGVKIFLKNDKTEKIFELQRLIKPKFLAKTSAKV